jgi:hypothetical protein
MSDIHEDTLAADVAGGRSLKIDRQWIEIHLTELTSRFGMRLSDIEWVVRPIRCFEIDSKVFRRRHTYSWQR